MYKYTFFQVRYDQGNFGDLTALNGTEHGIPARSVRD